MRTNRRGFIKLASAAGMATACPSLASVVSEVKPDIRLKLEECTLEIGKGIAIRTAAYNGQLPGPTLRLREGKPVCIEVANHTSRADLVHWHGLRTDPANDGAVEEGSSLTLPGKTLQYHLKPEPAGTRWYHSHAMALDDLEASTYSGQFGFLLVDGAANPGQYDQEVNLAVHHWGAHFIPMVETMRLQSQNVPQTTGSDVGYKWATMNAHMLGHGEPVRVRQGQRVLFRLLNASATENIVLSLPGHTFRIVAMDGNPVSNQCSVEVISLGVAERVDAVVEMNSPGVWIFGSTLEKAREIGLGIVIEYAGKTGEAVWRDPSSTTWEYAAFGSKNLAPEPEKTFTLTIRDAGALDGSRFDTWTINGEAWPKVTPIMVSEGRRYRLIFRNATGDQHPMHLHRHSFEVTRIGDQRLSGLIKDTVNVMPLQEVAVDFLADNPGDSLLHCHQQLHMDYGFMQIVKYAG